LSEANVTPVFDCIVGVDQTGAVTSSGKPRALATTVLIRKGDDWVLHATHASGKPMSLPCFNSQYLEILLESFRHSLDANVGLMVDCVLGLPWTSWKSAGERPGDLRSLIRHCAQADAYGRKAGEAFFSKWNSEPDFPRRQCERISGSNSVFQIRPHQKNIQTGTYRIWRDLALAGDEDYFSFWPFDTPRRGRPWIFEGYPTFYWRSLFGRRSRSPEAFASVVTAVRSYGISVRVVGRAAIARDPNLADAAVLALAGLVLQHRSALFCPFEQFPLQLAARAEGWIAGVSPP
jgi:hypothetical protein